MYAACWDAVTESSGLARRCSWGRPMACESKTLAVRRLFSPSASPRASAPSARASLMVVTMDERAASLGSGVGLGFELFCLVVGDQRVEHGVELTLHKEIELMESKPYAVIGDPV